MKFDINDLFKAQKAGIITSEQFENLCNFFSAAPEENRANSKKFTIEYFLYYFGAILIMIAMGWYLGNVFEKFQESGLFIICLIYILIFTVIGNILWMKGKKTPGGLLYTCAISTVPLTVWAFEKTIGIFLAETDYSQFHVFVRSCYISMEVITVIVGLIYLKFRKFPFLTLPVCWALWYLSMDIVPLFSGNFVEPTWVQRCWTSIGFALFMLAMALSYDKKTKEDFSGWLYIFGAIMLWSAIIRTYIEYEVNNEFMFFLLFGFGSFLYMIISVLLGRKVFMVLGAISLISYLGHLAYVLFEDSIFFPFALITLGLAIIFTTVYYAKNCNIIEEKLRKIIFAKTKRE